MRAISSLARREEAVGPFPHYDEQRGIGRKGACESSEVCVAEAISRTPFLAAFRVPATRENHPATKKPAQGGLRQAAGKTSVL